MPGDGADAPPVHGHRLPLGVHSLADLGRQPVHGHAAGGDHGLRRAPRGDARVGQRLLEPDLRHHRPAPRRAARPQRARRADAVIGRAASSAPAHPVAIHLGRPDLRQALRGLGVERRQVVERGQPEAFQELEARAVEDGPARRVGAALLGDEAAMEQAAHDRVGVDAADPLDDAARDRLAVGDDGQRLERCRREPESLGAGVAGDDRTCLGGGRELDPVADREEPDAPVAEPHLEVAEPRVHRLEGDAGKAGDLAPGERSLGDEEECLELDDGQVGLAGARTGAREAVDEAGIVELVRGRRGMASAAWEGSSIGSRAVSIGSGEVGQRLVDGRLDGHAAALGERRRPAGDRAPGRLLLGDHLAALDELEEGQEGDRHHHPVVDVRQEVLEDDRGGAFQRRADDRRPIGEGDRARHDLRRRRRRRHELDAPRERRHQRPGIERRPVGGPRAGLARCGGSGRFAVVEPRLRLEPLAEDEARVAIEPIDDEAAAERLLRVDLLRGQARGGAGGRGSIARDLMRMSCAATVTKVLTCGSRSPGSRESASR